MGGVLHRFLVGTIAAALIVSGATWRACIAEHLPAATAVSVPALALVTERRANVHCKQSEDDNVDPTRTHVARAADGRACARGDADTRAPHRLRAAGAFPTRATGPQPARGWSYAERARRA